MGQCPLCNQEAETEVMPRNSLKWCRCEFCGEFNITGSADCLINESTYKKVKPKLSAFLKHRTLKKLNEVTIIEEKVLEEILKDGTLPLTVDDILSIFPKTITERVDNMLVNFSIISEYPGQYISVTKHQYPLFYTESDNHSESLFMAQEAQKNGYIDVELEGDSFKVRLTQLGWDRVATIENKKDDFASKQGFIAMWFNNSMDAAAEAIKKAITDAGYVPMRIDMSEHNDKICDRIIAEIRRSKFVVSDFTGHRGGVYFEAGFALGLGLPVIWTCRGDNIDSAHFDTRQYNHIVWSTEDDLYNKLKNRILATVI